MVIFVPMHIDLIPVATSELPLVADLAFKIWNDHYPSVIGQKQVDYMLNKFYSLPSLQEQVQRGQVFYFIKSNEVTEGFISVTHTTETQELFIHKFYILTQKQKSGWGTLALEKMESLYPSAKFIRLTVNRQNHKSINFYFKNGFTIEKVADFDIGDGYVMNDFVMLKKR